MRKLSIFIWGIIFFLLIFRTSFAGQWVTTTFNDAIFTCQNYLIEAGFENIQFQIARNQTIWIAYENRRYRNEITALGVVLGYAAECFSSASQFVIVPKYRDVPLKYIRVDREMFKAFVHNEISTTAFLAHLKISFQPVVEKPLQGYSSHNARSSFFKFDLIASPGLRVQFARPEDPAQLQINFLTDLSFTMTPGLQFNGQLVMPLYNEFQKGESKSRLGQLYLNQFIQLPSNTFFSMSVGLFEYYCHGISTKLKRFFWQDRLALSARLDYLKTNSLKELLKLDSPVENQFSYLIQANYRFNNINFQTKLTWGRYVLGDEAWRIDIVRTFHELELGFMGVWNKSLEFLTGMTVRLPFPVSRHPHPGKIRLRTPNYIPWNYRYLPCYDGFILNTGEDFEEIAQQFSISFIRANIDQFQTAIRYVKLHQPDRSHKLLAQKGQ